MFINNKWVDAQSGETFDSVNPYTGTAWARVPRASARDVDAAVQAARQAFDDGPWGRLKTVWVELSGVSRDPFKLG